MEYNFKKIEADWQKFWAQNHTFRAVNNDTRPKYYVLDMFPYPSGAGLHVGHPLGYIASDIVSRYKRHQGFNVLHPMGYDSFGLPAEQYAIQTGQHPAVTTEQNIKRYREQLDKIGFSFDWEREVRTSDPEYYKWTQWIFIQLYNCWFNPNTHKAEKIETLIAIFEKEGYTGDYHDVLTGSIEEELGAFTPEDWKNFSEQKKQQVLMHFRLAYLGEAYVNWCAALGTVLANDEVKDGVSERGGHPVERKLMKQWSLRITAYSQRLLDGLDTVDWPESLKEAQRNWIGRSEGCSATFQVAGSTFQIEVFTTRPDTIFGVSFVTLAPEHELVDKITTPEHKNKVEAYKTFAKNRSERERMADVKNITGEFTGAYVLHPFSGKKIPVWVGDYVLAGYGTGAVMAVPAHDSRDHAFAKHFGLDIIEVVTSPEGHDIQKESYDAKEGKCINSDFLNGLEVKKAIKKAIQEIEQKEIGYHKVNYRLRDAVFGRQRYWGEPIPVYYKDGIPYTVDEDDLPIRLPEVDKFLPTETGEPPLARAKDWCYKPLSRPLPAGEDLGGANTPTYPLETTTMPGWAGSSWYFLRYMDAKNETGIASKEAIQYWGQIDLYVGGAEHATGHLLYFRFWNQFLYDLGIVPFTEPAKKLVNQGMIQGNSAFLYYVSGGSSSAFDDFKYPFYICVSADIVKQYLSGDKTSLENKFNSLRKTINPKMNDETQRLWDLEFTKVRISIDTLVDGVLSVEEFTRWKKDDMPSYRFISNDRNQILPIYEVEKMSKSKWNVVSPDVNDFGRPGVIEIYGADSLRLYEMFLGPLTEHKPWDTKGIEGVYRFLRKAWRLFYTDKGDYVITDNEPTKEELKALHKCIKRVTEDIERMSFNTVVSQFMITVNEFTDLKCHTKKILETFLVLLSPYAPHITEELWNKLGHAESISREPWPAFDEKHVTESNFLYPVSFNGKTRFNLELPVTLTTMEIEKEVMAHELTGKYLEGKTPKKVIIVPKRIVNIVM